MRLPERYRPLARAHLGIEVDDALEIAEHTQI